MRPRDERVYLYDVSAACTRIVEFTAGRSVENYREDAMVRSAVERQFEIIGEALNLLRQSDPGLAGRITDASRIIADHRVQEPAHPRLCDSLRRCRLGGDQGQPARAGTGGRLPAAGAGDSRMTPAPPDPSLPARLREFHERLPLAGDPGDAPGRPAALPSATRRSPRRP